MHGLIDYIVDGNFAAVPALDESIEDLEDQLFSDVPMDREVQRRSCELRKSLVLLRRVVLPMREVVNHPDAARPACYRPGVPGHDGAGGQAGR